MNYYNENDPFAAAWLRKLIAAGHIAPGDVDERSIVDVQPDDVRGYRQCHWFAGIGGWSYALRLAGWADDRPVWTGSCPCQPFSAAGTGAEFADERHLWPAWFRLIRECRPDVVFGEQVSSKDALAWFDHVSTDLEAEGYAVGALDTCAAGVGAPHIRQRLYFIALSQGWNISKSGIYELGDARCVPERRAARSGEEEGAHDQSARHSHAGLMAYADGRHPRAEGIQRGGQYGQQPQDGATGVLADAECSLAERYGQQLGSTAGSSQGQRHQRQRLRHEPEYGGNAIELGNPIGTGSQGLERSGDLELHGGAGPLRPVAAPGATNGFWTDAEWIACRDGKWRAVEPGSPPLAYGLPNRMGRLRGYGNAICAPLAAEFIRAAIG